MHVLQVIDSVDRVGGAERAAVAMAPQLIRRGITLDIAYLLDLDGFQPELAEAGVSLFGVHHGSRAGSARGLARVIRDRRPDLVHTTLYEADIAGRIAALATGVPVVSSLVNTSYGAEMRAQPGIRPWKLRAAQGLDAASARGVRRFHALTEHVAGVMSRRLGVRRSRIEVVPRGRDRELLAAARDRRELTRAALGIGADVPVLVTAARQEYQKGLDVLITAFARVRREVPDAVLLLAGPDGSRTESLRRLAAETGGIGDSAGRAEPVRFLGHRDDVPDLMGAADVFVLPSRWEGLGSVLIEAMGVGTPIVTSDLPPVREITGAGDCAALVPPDSPEALATALVAALTEREKTAMRTEAAYRRFGEEYTIDSVCDRMVAFYARAIDPRAGRDVSSGPVR
ncbi:glycosyltransferase [Embleya scabrispora]|uniref:glycosyltransferase n=1 Tax=Embleya scabrispora TaxID=159449 RepID=UPI000381417A|nr:glycosyltransferase [Embleya scabrispora]MYS78694.1 glycosyltransferase [Streptomyces sp. SID5474]